MYKIYIRLFHQQNQSNAEYDWVLVSGSIHDMVLYMTWCYTSHGAIHHMVLYMTWCYTSHGAIHDMVLYITWS
jgi:hypothetical protein